MASRFPFQRNPSLPPSSNVIDSSQLPPYLRHPPELMEKQDRAVDDDVVEEVCALRFPGITR